MNRGCRFLSSNLSPSRRRGTPRWRLAALAVGCALAAASVAPVAAEEADPALTLTGITGATLGASQLTPDGARCGLDLGRLVNAARQPMRQAGLEVREDAATRVTLSAVTAQIVGGQCATAVLLGVYARESFFSAAAGWMRSGHVVLWQRSLMVATPQDTHVTAVDDGARRLTVQMLGAWREQNAAGRAVAVDAAAVPPRPRP